MGSNGSAARATGIGSPGNQIIVVGGGIVGMAIGHALLREGRRVVVIDPGLAEQRCSYGNAGSLSSSSVAPLGMPGVVRQVPGWLLDPQAPLYVNAAYWLRVTPWLIRFVLASNRTKVEGISHALSSLLRTTIPLYSQLLQEIGASDLLSRRGQLQLYPSHEYRARDDAVWRLKRERGAEVTYVERGEITDLEPNIGERYACGVFLPEEGLVTNPGRLIEQLAASFASRGGVIATSRVRSFQLESGAVAGVVTDTGITRASAVVVAAGAWSSNLSRQLGDNLPLQTQRGYHVMLPQSGVSVSRPVVAADRKYFVSPMETGLRIAGTVEFDDLNKPPNYDRARTLMRSVTELFPDIDTSAATMWMGNRPCFPDSLPVIDRASRHSNVLYAFGNGHLGLTAAPMMGLVIADMIEGRKPRIDLAPFAVSRF